MAGDQWLPAVSMGAVHCRVAHVLGMLHMMLMYSLGSAGLVCHIIAVALGGTLAAAPAALQPCNPHVVDTLPPPCTANHQAQEEAEEESSGGGSAGGEEEAEEGDGEEDFASYEEAKLLLEALAAADPDVHTKVASKSTFCSIM